MTEATKIPVLAVVGPTASGKTAAGVMLSQCYHGEVVSADSMQIYEGLDIATAKPTPEEMCGIPHHLIGCVPMDANFSVADYLALAKPVIADIHRRGKLPVLVGGAGMYVSSLLSTSSSLPHGRMPGCGRSSSSTLRRTATKRCIRSWHSWIRRQRPPFTQIIWCVSCGRWRSAPSQERPLPHARRKAVSFPALTILFRSV